THVPPRITRRDAVIAPARLESEIPVAGTEAVLPEPVIEDVPSPELFVEDDRGEIRQGDRVLLIVEDDPNYAKVLLETARGRGFKAVVAQRGSAALALAREMKPDAITLDIRLPDFDGWRVLDRLKVDLATRHIPVQIITVDENTEPTLTQGALGYLVKSENKDSLQNVFEELKSFVERPMRNLLLIEDDEIQQMNIRELIGNGDVKTTVVGSGTEALSALNSGKFDCMVLDLGLPDMSGVELLEKIKNEPHSRSIPIIIYTARDLLHEEELRLRRLAENIVLKDVRSPERLLDETAMLLHRNASKLPERQRKMLETLHQGVL